MNIGAVIVLFKLLGESGIVSPRPAKPPRSEAGLRPNCGLGKKAVLIDDRWVCIPEIPD